MITLPLEPTIRDLPYSFASQARQFPKKGKPGLRWETHEVRNRPVHCLLHRGNRGQITGILYFYPQDIYPWEKAGNVNILVHPQRRGKGIGRLLLAEADAKWPINFEQQDYTPEGLAFVRKYLGVTE